MKLYQVKNKRLGNLFALNGGTYVTNDYMEAVQARDLIREILEDTGRESYKEDVIIVDESTGEEIV